MNNDSPYQRQQWNNALEEYVLTGQVSDGCTTLVENIGYMKCHTISQQLLLVGSLPNYHWWQVHKM